MSTSQPSPSWSPDLAHVANDLTQLLAWSPYPIPNRDNHLDAALNLHGLRRTDLNLPYDYWQNVLINHFFNGFCFSGGGNACSIFHHYRSPASLSRDIYLYVISAVPPPSIDALLAVCVAQGFPQAASRGGQARPDIDTLFLNLAAAQDDALEHPELSFFFARDATRCRTADLHLWLRHHGVPAAGNHDSLFYSLFFHIVTGACLVSNPAFQGCKAVRNESECASNACPVPPNRHMLYLANLIMQCKSPSAVARFLAIYNVPPPNASPNLEDLLVQVDCLRRPLQRALLQPMLTAADVNLRERFDRLKALRSSWPQAPSQGLKNESISKFRAATSSDALRCRACASCGASVLVGDTSLFSVKNVDMDLFKHTGSRRDEQIPFPLPFADHPVLDNAVLEPAGVEFSSADGDIFLHICVSCKQSIISQKVPRLALANSLYVGAVPSVLKDLTIIEESLIARARAKCMVVQLQFNFDSPAKSPINQRAIRGNVVIFPQHPEALPFLLPPSVNEILEYVCVVFVGSKMPEPQWFQQHAYPLLIRPDRVRKALEWLKMHNKLYENVRLNEEMLQAIPPSGMLPYHVEHIVPSAQQAATTSGYDPDNPAPSTDPHARVPFTSLVVANVGHNAKSGQLRSAALRHIRENRGAFLAVPHDPFFVNEFSNPHLFPSLYPTLFPYGVAGIEDAGRRQRVSFESHVKQLLSLHDRRFQEHPSFLFTVFNIAQRRTMLRSVHLQTQRSRFNSIAKDLSGVSADAVHSVAAYLKHVKDGAPFFQPSNEEELLVQKLMYQVNYVSRGVPGTNSSRLAMRNEIRAMVISMGVPQLFITLNPADNRNPIVKFLAGADIDIDDLQDFEVPEYWAQSCLVAKNPFVAAKFFNLYVKAFISEILRWKQPGMEDFAGDDNTRVSIFGVTRGFYGAVEAQGRGTLHVHMVVWCEGGLNPNELKERLLRNPDFAARFTEFAEDAISTSLPEDPGPDVDVQSNHHHPCSVRGPKLDETTPMQMHAKDLYNVVDQCQTHEHKPTCYKYWNGPPEPKTCRFDLDPSFSIPESLIDPETGEFTVRHENGMINKFNDTIIRALRNNMDIKIIGSGESAKAIVFYITDYISKSQLKIHVAFSALEEALRKLEDSNEPLDDTAQKGKRILQKCAYEMLGRQEMSAPQVASVLMDYEDHFTSHKFRCLFWTSADAYVDAAFSDCKSPTAEKNVSSGNEGPIADGLPSEGINGDAPPVTDTIFEDDADEQWQDEQTNEEGESDQQRNDERRPEDSLNLDDEVILEVGDDGELNPRASQLRDYLYRGRLLDDISLWDFVARVSKARTSKTGRDAPTMDAVRESASFFEGIKVLDCATVDRPMCQFLSSHDEHKTSYLSVCHPLEEFIPVLIGPALPRRDRPDVYEKYCRLMLIFFKPWRQPADLRGAYADWELAFQAFRSSPLCTADISHKLVNMQVFHECKDSRDEHYRNRRTSGPGFSSEMTDRDDINAFAEDAFAGQDGETDDRLMSSMLKKLNATFSRRENKASERVLQILNAAADAGIVHSSNMHGFEEELSQTNANSALAHVDVSETGTLLEQQWKVSYRERSTQWKYGGSEDDEDEDGEGSRDTSQDPDRPLPPPAPQLPTVVNLSGMSVTAKEQLRDQTARDWTLNEEQEYAFRIMANQMITPSTQPLRMLVGGAAGTGKTRVIDALRDFVARLGHEHRLLLASFMGIAAKNINGVTLHSALNLGKLSRMKPYGKMHQELISLWEGKDWLVIDEVSMLSLSLLYDINEGLQMAKESDAPFGGVNIVFLGDFAQLPPVAQTRLYSILEPSKAKKATPNAQKVAFGKLLWLAVDTVCFLTEIKRQQGKENQGFVDMLSRLRVAACTDADYDLLNSRLLSQMDAKLFDGSDSPWRDAPIIVTENAAKDALNEACSIQFALDNKCELHWYHARDFHHGKEIMNESLRDMLSSFDSGRTNQRLAKIPLCIGMPVLVSQNFDVQHGIVNGTRGVVKTIRYTTNSAGERCLTSCVITVDGDTGSAMYALEKNEMPILCDQVTVDIYNSKTRENIKFQRQQAAILPAFAMTAHRAQGQTMTHVIVDLESCKTIEAAYVMVSRAKCLDGVLVLRPFAKSRINGKQPDGLRMELHRLQVLSLKTKLRLGSPEERVEARRALSDLERVKAGSTDIPSVKESVVTRNTRDLDHEETLVLKMQQQTAVAFGAPQTGINSIDAPQTSHSRQRRKRKRGSAD